MSRPHSTCRIEWHIDHHCARIADAHGRRNEGGNVIYGRLCLGKKFRDPSEQGRKQAEEAVKNMLKRVKPAERRLDHIPEEYISESLSGVYFIQVHGLPCGYEVVKIGASKNVKARKRDLRSGRIVKGQKLELRLLHVEKCAPEDIYSKESEMHYRFRVQRLPGSGELFQLDSELKDFLLEVQTPAARALSKISEARLKISDALAETKENIRRLSGAV